MVASAMQDEQTYYLASECPTFAPAVEKHLQQLSGAACILLVMMLEILLDDSSQPA